MSDTLRADVTKILEDHAQSARNQRCTCGWRPEFPQSKHGSEGLQHRNHVADKVVEYLDEWYE